MACTEPFRQRIQIRKSHKSCLTSTSANVNVNCQQVRKMTMISPTNKEVQIGQTLKDDEFIGMVRHLPLAESSWESRGIRANILWSLERASRSAVWVSFLLCALEIFGDLWSIQTGCASCYCILQHTSTLS